MRGLRRQAASPRSLARNLCRVRGRPGSSVGEDLPLSCALAVAWQLCYNPPPPRSCNTFLFVEVRVPAYSQPAADTPLPGQRPVSGRGARRPNGRSLDGGVYERRKLRRDLGYWPGRLLQPLERATAGAKGKRAATCRQVVQILVDCDGDTILVKGQSTRPGLPRGVSQLLLSRALRRRREGRARAFG